MGYLSTLPDGADRQGQPHVLRVDRPLAPSELLGARFQDLLTVGGRVFHETHLVPLLRMQGAVREIALDVVRVDGSVLPCLLNAVELRDDDGAPVLVRATLFEATARRRYERELLAAQRAAEESEARSRTVQQVVSDLAAATSVGRRRGGDRRARPGGAGRAGRRAGAGRGGPRRAADGRGCTPSTPTGLSDDAAARAARGGARPAARWSWRRACGPCRSTTGCGASRPAVAAADGRRRPVRASCVVPVTADSRRLGVLVLGPRRAGQGELISLDEPEAARADRAGRRRAALDARPAGRPGAGAGAAARGDGAAGGAGGVPARGGPAAGRGRRRRPRPSSGSPTSRSSGWPTSASSTSSPSTG